MKKTLLLTSIILCAAGSFAADRFTTERLPVDEDAVIAQILEYQEMAEAQVAEADLVFQSYDLNSDGYINLEEAAVEQFLVDQFIILDVNEDSLLSEMEFNNRVEATN
jgi:hypothetical protein